MLTVPFSFSEQSRAILEKSILARRERRGQAPGIRMILGVRGPARDWDMSKREITLEI